MRERRSRTASSDPVLDDLLDEAIRELREGRQVDVDRVDAHRDRVDPGAHEQLGLGTGPRFDLDRDARREPRRRPVAAAGDALPVVARVAPGFGGVVLGLAHLLHETDDRREGPLGPLVHGPRLRVRRGEERVGPRGAADARAEDRPELLGDVWHERVQEPQRGL